MTRSLSISWLVLLILFSACARIPSGTVGLTDMLISEGTRMHHLNMALVNNMFAAKQEKLDDFIQDEYLPKYIDEFTARIPDGTDLQNELPAILLAMVPEITERRNAMQRALEEQRMKVIARLGEDHENFRMAAVELRNLLRSAVDVEEEKQEVYSKVSDLSKGNINLDKIETAIDSFIIEAGEISNKATRLNEEVNQIIGDNK